MSISTYITAAETQKTALAANLTTMGRTAADTEPLADLVGKVLNISDDADAAITDIATGKTAYVGGAKITGTAAGASVLSGDAVISDVVAGKTFYSDDPDTLLTGTLVPLDTSSGDAVSGDIWLNKIAWVDGAEITGSASIVDVTNFIANGNFSSTTGWTPIGATVAAASNILSVTGNGTRNSPYCSQASAHPLVAGDKIYYKLKARVTNASAEYIRFFVCDAATTNITDGIAIQNTPTINEWYTLEGIGTVPVGMSGNASVLIQHKYVDNATANGKVMENMYAITVNLTNAFGAGNEPATAAEFRAWLGSARNYPSTLWFNNFSRLLID